jgi:hypothetical protein
MARARAELDRAEMELDRYKARPGKEVDKSWFDRSTRKLTHTEEVMEARLMEAEALEVQAKKLKLEADRARADIEALRKQKELRDPQANDGELERAMDAAATRLSVLQDSFKGLEHDRLLQDQLEQVRRNVKAADARALDLQRKRDELERALSNSEGGAAQAERVQRINAQLEDIQRAEQEEANRNAERKSWLKNQSELREKSQPKEGQAPRVDSKGSADLRATDAILRINEAKIADDLSNIWVNGAHDAAVRRTLSLQAEDERMREKDATISDLAKEVQRLKDQLAELGTLVPGVGVRSTGPINKSK